MWLLECIQLSLDSAVGKFENNWYRGEIGIPTGGTLCVHLADITVYKIFRVYIYYYKPISLVYMKRFVDDGTGGWMGSLNAFMDWVSALNCKLLENHGLEITYKLHKFDKYIEFLDIRYKFDNYGTVHTDIFTKPTDAHRYLNYRSFHPRHVFRSVVYSQGLRYKSRISDPDTLEIRLNELKSHFMECDYPASLVTEVLNDVGNPEILSMQLLGNPVKVF